MSTVTKPILLDETFESKMDELIEAVGQSGGAKPKTWQDIQRVCRIGTYKQWLEIGDTYSFKRNNTVINAKVMGFISNGRNGSIKIKNDNLTNGVIFQTVDCLYSLQFDEKEAFYYAPDGLTAGNYCFTLGQHTWVSGDVGKTFYFTLANNLPAGGQLVFNQAYNATLENAKINVFTSATTYTTVEQPTMSSTAISGATNLGTLNNTFSGNFNSCQRACLGNNRWKESAMRQHLNSNSVAGSVWSPQNNWDRCPYWGASTAGFINGLTNDFTDYVAECEIDTYKNTLCDGGGLDTTDDKFFLPGRMELFIPSEATADNGVAWDYYKDGSVSAVAHTNADAIRIKGIMGGSATYWWMRSPDVGNAYSVRLVSPTGAGDRSGAIYSHGVAPDFVIA